MARPLIGITGGIIYGGGNRLRRQEAFFGCGAAYVEQVAGSGGTPLVIPPTTERKALAPALESLDALLLSGGGDLSSLEFGAEPSPAVRYIDPPRDRTEIEAVRFAVRRRMPILAICRGIQVLNVALGGDLVQDIASEIANPIRHWSTDLLPGLTHTIEVEKGSLLASLVGAGRIAVNSTHHQAVGRLGRGLVVTARAPDGVIEAIEARDRSPILGIQFHPEEIAGEHGRFRSIFDWLVREGRRYGRARREGRKT